MSDSMVSTSNGLIAVMGATGTGKSSFINAIAGTGIARVGHGLESETSEIGQYTVTLPNGATTTLVDTPGFNDFKAATGGKSDVTILREIAKYLTERYDKDQKFAGILYFHSICDARVGNVSQRHMTMFAKLCGTESMQNVVVVTTFWDQIGFEKGVEKELQLETNPGFLKQLKDGGARFIRHGQFKVGSTPEGPGFQSPHSIVYDLLGMKTVFVALQEELAQGKSLSETAAGAQLNDELEQLKHAHEEELSKLRGEIESLRQSYKDEMELRSQLEEECRALKEKLQLWEDEQATLDKQLGDDVDLGSRQEPHIPEDVIVERDVGVTVALEEPDLNAIMKPDVGNTKTAPVTLHHVESQYLEMRLKSLHSIHAEEMRQLKLQHATELQELSLEISNLRQTSAKEVILREHLEEELNDLRGQISRLKTDLDHLSSLRQQEIAEKMKLLQDNKRLRASIKRHDMERWKYVQEFDDMRQRHALVQKELQSERHARRQLEMQSSGTVDDKGGSIFNEHSGK